MVGIGHITCSMAASTAASVALVKGTTSLPVKRRRICTAVVLGLGLLAEALVAAALGGAAAGAIAMDRAAAIGPGAAAMAAAVGLPP